MPVRYDHQESKKKKKKKKVLKSTPVEQEPGKQNQCIIAIRMSLYSSPFIQFFPLISDIAWRPPDGQNEATNSR